ncbi:MAG: sodium:solute symporter family protein [Verrucomicrobiae bacterium]|nr:sodium:solute symporter family protein [Verrucomicrobiae bacterium]
MTQFNWWLDGSIVGLYLLATMVAGVMVRKYVGRVEDFIVAGREMNVYLGIASLAATEFGIVTCMYTAQNGYDKGFAGAVPGILNALAMFVVGVTGFCIKPLRDSGAMTIPELMNRRYGPFVRWLAGWVIVLGGLLNMGVFLRVGGEFLVYTCNMQPTLELFGFRIETLVFIMTILLVGVAVYTILGGMLSVLVTDFLQFVVMSTGLLAVTALILGKIGWSKLVAAVEMHHGAGGFNPFVHPQMGWQYVIFNFLLNTAAVLTWQTAVSRVLAAKDSRTGMRVYAGTAFFFVCRFLIPGLWGIAALATLAPGVLPMKADGSGPNTLLAMPMFLGQFVPVGLMGILIAAMLAADMSTDSAYMLTWGSVIYNDIICPVRAFLKRKAWGDKKGLLINRCIIACIGFFLLFFGLWYQPPGDLWTYLGVTGTIYLASMSTLLVACCYWRRANNWGAIAANVVGAVMPVSTLILQKIGPWTVWFTNNATLWNIGAFVFSWVAMIVGSLLKPQVAKHGGKSK